MKKFVFLLFLLPLLLTGCTSYTELNQLGIISCLGIDYQNEEYILYANIITGVKEEQSVGREITSFVGQGKTIEEAMEKIYLKSGKKLYLSHMNLLLLNERALKENTKEILNSFLENPESRNQFRIAYLHELEFQEIFQKEDLEKIINELISNNEIETGFSSSVDFERFIEQLLTDKNAFLPSITKEGEDYRIEGTLFIENYRPKKIFEEEESILLSFLQNKITKTRIDKIPVFSNATFLETEKNKVTIRLESTILEEDEKRYKSELKKKLEQFLEQSIQNGEDLLKLQERIRKNDFSYYQKNKDHLLEKLQFKIEVNTIILQSEIYRKEVLPNEE